MLWEETTTGSNRLWTTCASTNTTTDGSWGSGGPLSSRSRLWGSLPCDTHIITEVLVRFGRRHHPATRQGLTRIAADLQVTNQGRAWTCIPDPAVGFRGPGRKGDICPQVTLEALRTFARLPPDERPDGLETAAASLLEVWRNRGSEQPYMFGHGYRFKVVKWPPLWYGAYWMLDTLGRYPSLWRNESGVARRFAGRTGRLPGRLQRFFRRHGHTQIGVSRIRAVLLRSEEATLTPRNCPRSVSCAPLLGTSRRRRCGRRGSSAQLQGRHRDTPDPATMILQAQPDGSRHRPDLN